MAVGIKRKVKSSAISPLGTLLAEYLRSLELSFFRHYLKGAPDPGLPKAILFETGANVWKKFNQWPPPTITQRLYFHARGKLAFDRPTERNAFDEYVSDPNNPLRPLRRQP